MNWILERLGSFNNRQAICYKDEIISYTKLYEQIIKYTELIKDKIPSGSAVVLISDYTPASIAMFFSLIENKNIIVPIFNSSSSEINEKVEESYADFIITFKDDDIKISAAGKSNDTHPLIKELKDNHSAGLILFSSGSTGKPKSMLHNLDNLLLSYKRDYTKDINTLIFMTIDHIGGIDTLFRQISIGGCITIPEERTPDHICRLIEKFKVNVLPVSPTFLNLFFLSESYRKYDLSSLEIIGYGAEPISDIILEKLNTEFPGIKIQQKFGTSETNAVRISNLSSNSSFMKITDPNIEYKIVDNELWLKSRTQILGYLNTEMDNFTENGWFKTGDFVDMQENGYFKITGRINEIINVGGQKVFPLEVESILLEYPEITDCMVYSQSNAITGQNVAADIVLKEGTEIKDIKKLIRIFCKSRLDDYKIPTKINFVDKTNYNERFKKIRRNIS